MSEIADRRQQSDGFLTVIVPSKFVRLVQIAQ